MSWSHPAFAAVAGLVAARSGLRFQPERAESDELSMRRAMVRSGITDPEHYRERIETSAALLDDLLGELTIGETYFFREPGQFAFLRREALPEIRRRRGPEHAIRVWSAGCASGEEPYSLAILLTQEGLAERAHVLATDISRAALARAHAGRYTAWSLRGEGAAEARPFLARSGKDYLLDEKLRRRVTFAYLNLALDAYPSLATGTWDMDIILCRNVLIYMNPEIVAKLARALFASLSPGGWLLTASSDPPLATAAPFEHVVTDEGVFYRRGQRESMEQQGRALHAPVAEVLSDRYAAVGIEPDDGATMSTAVPEVARARTPVHRSSRSRPPEKTAARLRRGPQRAPVVTREVRGNTAAVVLEVRQLASRDAAAAERACAAAATQYPLAEELTYLHAVLLMDLGRNEEARCALRRVLYLDPSLAIAHFTLGALLRRQGNQDGARRAYGNAQKLSAGCPPDAVLPLGDGEQAGRLAEAAAFQLALLDDSAEPM